MLSRIRDSRHIAFLAAVLAVGVGAAVAADRVCAAGAFVADGLAAAAIRGPGWRLGGRLGLSAFEHEKDPAAQTRDDRTDVLNVVQPSRAA